jgi:hypothetical protein
METFIFHESEKIEVSDILAKRRSTRIYRLNIGQINNPGAGIWFPCRRTNKTTATINNITPYSFNKKAIPLNRETGNQ